MKKYEISEDLLQGLLNYLAGKPYLEVHQVLPVLQKLPEIMPVVSQESPAVDAVQPALEEVKNG